MPKPYGLMGKVNAHLRAALQIDETVPYLARDIIVNVLKPVRRITWSSQYHVRGRVVHLVHGSDDTFVFQEIFADRLYEPPPEVLAALPTRPLAILDLGGNIGLFGLWTMVTWPDSTITAYEPDPTNASRYRQFLQANESDWNVIEAYADNKRRTVYFSNLGKASSAATSAGRGIQVEAVDVLPLMMTADIVKMDIEGGEWDILLDQRMTEVSAPVFVLEYHIDSCPFDNPRSHSESIFRRLGYNIVDIFHSDSGVGMFWAYKS